VGVVIRTVWSPHPLEESSILRPPSLAPNILRTVEWIFILTLLSNFFEYFERGIPNQWSVSRIRLPILLNYRVITPRHRILRKQLMVIQMNKKFPTDTEAEDERIFDNLQHGDPPTVGCLFTAFVVKLSRQSSLSTATDYGLDDRMIGVRILAGARNLSLRHRVQIGPGAHPAPYQMSTRVSFPEVKRPGREADYSSPSSAGVKEWVELYLHSPNTSSWRGVWLSTGTTLLFTVTNMETHLLSAVYSLHP
jgi:hypothetical protein